MSRVVIPETPLTKALVVVGCTYEVVALTTGELPSWTELTQRRPVVGIALLGALAVHFWGVLAIRLWTPDPTIPTPR